MFVSSYCINHVGPIGFYLYTFGCRYIEYVTLVTKDTILVTKTPTHCGEICGAVCSILVVVKFSMWICQSCSGLAEVMYLLHLKYMHMYTSSQLIAFHVCTCSHLASRLMLFCVVADISQSFTEFMLIRKKSNCVEQVDKLKSLHSMLEDIMPAKPQVYSADRSVEVLVMSDVFCSVCNPSTDICICDRGLLDLSCNFNHLYSRIR